MLNFLSNSLQKGRILKYKPITNYQDINQVENFYKEFEKVNGNDSNNEQIKLSFKYWHTWGAPYLRSFVFTHKFEQCLNLKSPSIKFIAMKDLFLM